jgi:hypothetical protein
MTQPSIFDNRRVELAGKLVDVRLDGDMARPVGLWTPLATNVSGELWAIMATCEAGPAGAVDAIFKGFQTGHEGPSGTRYAEAILDGQPVKLARWNPSPGRLYICLESELSA